MGTYVTGSQVWDLLVNQAIGSPSRLDAATIEPFIVGVEAQVNGVLRGQGYALPLTNVADIGMIREQVRKKVAVEVFLALTQPVRSPDWCRTWDINFDSWLSSMRKGELQLTTEFPATMDIGKLMLDFALTEPEDDNEDV